MPGSGHAIAPRSRLPLVLAVDDEPEMLRSIGRTLRGLPIRLRFAETAEAALDAIEREPPDAIVSDHRLPGMSGLDLLEIVRRRWPGIRAILHTGDAAAQAHASLRSVHVVAKGSPPGVLRATVARVAGCG